MAGGGGNKKRYQYCTDLSGAILCLRALQGHSGRSLIDPTLQDNVLIPNDFFEYIYPEKEIGLFWANDLNAPRHAQYMYKAQKRHQNTVYWVDINLALRKGLKFYQTRSNAIIQFKCSQSNQPIPDHDRTGQLVVGTDRSGQPVVGTNPRIELSRRKTSRSQEIDMKKLSNI